MERRLDYIDVMKGIGIILVVMGHVSQNLVLNKIIYSFHMPLFFIISGILININKENYIKSKIKKILLPYFLYSIFFYLYWLFIERKLRNQSIDFIEPLKNIFFMKATDNGYIFNVVMWFLPCLFGCEIITYIVNKIIRKKAIANCFILMLSISSIVFLKLFVIDRLPFTLDCILISLYFYIIGNIIKDSGIMKLDVINSKLLMILLIGMIIIISQKFELLNIMALKIPSVIYFLIVPLLGTTVVYKVANKLQNSMILKLCGKNSMFIMIFHDPLKRIIIKMAEIITNISDKSLRSNIIFIIAITIFVIFLINLGIKIIRQIKKKMEIKNVIV